MNRKDSSGTADNRKERRRGKTERGGKRPVPNLPCTPNIDVTGRGDGHCMVVSHINVDNVDISETGDLEVQVRKDMRGIENL